MATKLFREPLFVFLVLGALIFTADALIGGWAPEDKGDYYRIRVTSQHLDAMRADFRNEYGRAPSDDELQSRLDRWLEEQMLYRQALALGLEEKDAIVRRQLVQKMRFLIEDALPVTEPDEAELHAWLQEHPERYGHGPTVSFRQVFISRGERGTEAEEYAGELLARLKQGAASNGDMGDHSAAGHVIKNADYERLRRDFGRDFAQAVLELPAGEWHGPIRSGLGLHLVRVSERSALRTARLEDVRDRVRNDLRLHRREQANEKAMQRLRQRFRIELEASRGSGAGG